MKSKPTGNGTGRVFGVLTLKPVPTSLQFAVEEVAAHRFFDCTNYDECLDIAVRKKWPNFTCQECPIWAFHKQRQKAEEEARAEGAVEEKK